MKIETVILKNLTCNEEFTRKILPYLTEELFQDKSHKLVFQEIHTYISKYNTLPNKSILKVAFDSKTNLNEGDFQNANELVDLITQDAEASKDNHWLVDQTEKFCQEQSLYNATLQAIQIMDGRDKTHDKGMIPKLLSDALAVSFDPNIGHDYLENAEQRYDYYHRVEERIPFDLEMFNKITKGGLPRKTLNVILAGVNVGKSLALCHVAAAALAQNKSVIYITLEMAEAEIAKRIDANLLDIDIDVIDAMSKQEYIKRADTLKKHLTKGKLIIKEYPTASAGSNHFKALLNECRLKKKFIPDIVIIDYINCCCSSRIRPGSAVNSYTYIKAISEELRGLAVENNIPILTATQLTRSGFGNSDPDMTDTAESFGLPATADWMIVMITSEELEGNKQLMIKQIKSRYYNVTQNRKFIVGVDRNKMKLFDVDDKYQKDLSESNQDARTPRQEDMQEAMETIRKIYKSPVGDIKV